MLYSASKTVLAALALACTSMAQDAATPAVTLSQGTFTGTTTMVADASTPVMKFLGIPFADKVERWAPPKPAPTLAAPMEANEEPAACIQQFSGTGASRNFTMKAFNNPPPEESEDCLTVNVFTTSMDGSKPVMFWLYGGGLAFGSNAMPAYDGSSFAANQDVVVVAPNYRTNGTCCLNLFSCCSS